MMKSTPVRSFGKVFETSLGKVFGKALWCHVLCLIVLCVIVGCADEVSETEYIVSPYTEQTMEFFERSSADDWPIVLATVQIGKKKFIVRKQTRNLIIYLDKHTLRTVPKKLVKGIVFQWLTIDSNGPFDPAVLKKILCAFGTINAKWLKLRNLEIDEASSYNDKHPIIRTLTQAPKCVLNIESLQIYTTPKSSIEWLQERVVLSESPIGLLIDCRPDFGNLEVLDGFSATEIISLTLYGIDKLDSMDCKLLREGPWPDMLHLDCDTPTVPEISEQIIQNMLAKEWMGLRVPISVWKELMKPPAQAKRLTADNLTIYLTPSQAQTLPPVGMNWTAAKHLRIDFRKDNSLVTITALEQTLDWVSRSFVGLEKIDVEGLYAPRVTDFVRSNIFDITTNPTLTRIRVCGISCLHDPNIIIPRGSNILCLSLEAWELYRSGKLGDELANSQADLSQLSPEQQAIVMSREEMAADDKPCNVCCESLDYLRSSSPDIGISILGHPKHSVCCRCLDGMVKARGTVGPIMCPVCRQEHRLPLFKNQIERNTQGVFEVTILTPPLSSSLPVLTFPRAIQPELPAI
ncbi:hypothetical protein NEDG_01773 [Nematocida displodere]|uniref:RING-type domain-containing protein n=1 Tax=Nematocida displodere TaxID=1805483 RepID=A0A177EH49_9MICR|nr:hypothetical protein NEDG_01773 [Nematocida displodere]